jgi:hypothetical protein
VLSVYLFATILGGGLLLFFFDPVSGQNDVYRRLEDYNSGIMAKEAAKRRDELADWLTGQPHS